MAKSGGPAPNILVVEARYYEGISDELFKGANVELERHGAAVERITVPGAFEIPTAIHMAIRSLDFFAGRPRFDGYIALGCVIRGATSHYDYVCQGVTEGLLRVSLDHGLPVAFGILTTEDGEQALARAGGDKGDKGREAVATALEMAGLLQAMM